VAEVVQRKRNEMIGAELGYRYAGSPVICNEPDGPQPEFREYVPTTWPGARLPHVWLDDGTAVQDRCGDSYVLLRLGRSAADTSGLERAFHARRAPFDVLSIDDACARDIYGRDLILLRPDLHVAWRDNVAPLDPQALVSTVTGYL